MQAGVWAETKGRRNLDWTDGRVGDELGRQADAARLVCLTVKQTRRGRMEGSIMALWRPTFTGARVNCTPSLEPGLCYGGR